MADPNELMKFGPVRTGHREAPPAGPVEMTIDYIKSGDRRHTLIAADGSKRTLGIPIEQLRSKFGGNTGFVTDPWGQQREVTLNPKMPSGQGILVKIIYKFDKGKGHGH